MPRLGLTMEEGKIIKWFKSEGERVEVDEPLFEIETEKITSEIKSPLSGILTKIIAPVGSTIPVTVTVAIIGEPEKEEIETTLEEEKKETEEVKMIKAHQLETRTNANRVSPLALKIAQKHDIDLSEIKGTGLGGTIIKGDVLKRIEERKQAPTLAAGLEILEGIEMSLPRRKTAERLSQMHRETPHVTITTPIDLTKLIKLRNTLKGDIEKKTGRKLTYTHIFAKVVSIVLKEYPELNSRLVDNNILKIKEINLGIAIETDEGLIVPVVKNAGEMNLTELVVKISELVDKARNKKLALDDITRGTFTISNIGMFDVDVFTPLINPPECAILGIGKMFKRAWVVNDHMEVRSIATFSLTFDHRIIDGAIAARFLQKIKENLQNAEENLKDV